MRAAGGVVEVVLAVGDYEVLAGDIHARHSVVFDIIAIVRVVAQAGKGYRFGVAGGGHERVLVAEVGDSPLGGFAGVVLPGDGHAAVGIGLGIPVGDAVRVFNLYLVAAERCIVVGVEMNQRTSVGVPPPIVMALPCGRPRAAVLAIVVVGVVAVVNADEVVAVGVYPRLIIHFQTERPRCGDNEEPRILVVGIV